MGRQAGVSEIEITPEMTEALSGWLADSVETGIYPGRGETVQIIRRLLELGQSCSRCRPVVS